MSYVTLLKDVMPSVIMPIVIMPTVLMIIVIMLLVAMLSFVKLKVFASGNNKLEFFLV
jgi:hypothetical protein